MRERLEQLRPDDPPEIAGSINEYNQLLHLEKYLSEKLRVTREQRYSVGDFIRCRRLEYAKMPYGRTDSPIDYIPKPKIGIAAKIAGEIGHRFTH